MWSHYTEGCKLNEIGQIITQLERQKAGIDKAITALREVSGLPGQSSIASKAAKSKTPVKRYISPEGRRRIAEATRKRWAAKRAADKAAAKKAQPAKKKAA